MWIVVSSTPVVFSRRSLPPSVSMFLGRQNHAIQQQRGLLLHKANFMADKNRPFSQSMWTSCRYGRRLHLLQPKQQQQQHHQYYGYHSQQLKKKFMHAQARDKGVLAKCQRTSQTAPRFSRSSTSLSNNGADAQTKAADPFTSWFQALDSFLRKSRTIPIPRWITPRHYTITASEVMGHSSFLLVAMSYAVDDFLMLRCIAVAGSTAMLFFTYFHPHGRVLWLPFKWNALFIALNSYRIGKVLWLQYCAECIPQELISLRENNFYLMDPVHFYKLIRLGTIKSIQKGDVLVAQGEHNPYVRVVLDGELHVLRDGKLNYILEEANFVSESGLHAGLLIPGSVESCCTVVADTEARVLVWNRTELVHLLRRDDSLKRALQAAMSWDVVRKLKYQRSLISRGLIDDPEAWTRRRTEQTQHRYSAILHNLLMHPGCVDRRQKELHKYRMIHHIDNDMHIKALQAWGWTVEEFEAGRKFHPDAAGAGDQVEEDDEDFPRNWKWYLQDLYWRIFG